MVGGGGCRCVVNNVRLGRVMLSQRSLRIIFTLILVGLVLNDCLVSCVIYFFCVLQKVRKQLISYNIFTA